MSRCSSLTRDLSLLAGGDLSPGEEEAVRRHLDRCGACSETLARLHWARRALIRAAWPEQIEEPSPDAFREEVLESVRDERPPAARGRARRWRRSPVALGAAACFAAGFLLFQGPGGDGLLERSPIPTPQREAVDPFRLDQPVGEWLGEIPHGLEGRSRLKDLVDDRDHAKVMAALDRFLQALEARVKEQR